MRIFWYSIKNYFRSLRFIFTPLGVMSLFFIIGLSIAIPGIIQAVRSLVDSIAATFGDYHVDWVEVGGYFWQFFRSQNWDDPAGTVNQFLDVNYLINSFKEILQQIFPTLPVDAANVIEMIQVTIYTIIGYILTVIVLLLVGFIIGFIVTRMFVKQDISKRRFWQRIVFSLLDVALSILVIVGIVNVLSLGGWGIVLSVLILLAHMIVVIIEGWLIHGMKHLKLKEALNIKNILFLILANLLFIALGVGIVVLVSLAKMVVLTVVIGLSIFVITNAVISANAEGYVNFLANDVWFKKETKKIEKKKKEEKAA